MGVEARQSPRYSRQLDVDIDGLEIVTTNVAIGGAQLCCPEMRYKGFVRSTGGPEVRLKMRVPGTQNWIGPVGRVCYADLCEDEYLIGFEFTELSQQDSDRWTAYIETLNGAKPIN